MISVEQKYQFIKVEDFFDGYKNWHRVLNADFQGVENNDVTLKLTSDIGTHTMLIQFVREDMFRVRFNPENDNYSSYNTRSIILDDFDTLRSKISDYSLNVNRGQGFVELTTIETNLNPTMKLVINYVPFSMEVYAFDDNNKEFKVLSTPKQGLYFIENGFEKDYSIIQLMNKNPTGKYIGFGEHGGIELSKNTEQLTYFNYDNMGYSQVYKKGPLENKEPLYHSDPFFMEFYGVPDKKSVYGIFIDNPSEVCMDIGYLNSSRYMFGTRYGCMDYYFMLGKCGADIINSFTSIVGKARLKPRYSLGYHQGCYGYDSEEKVKGCAKSYRDADIPLDGIHIDVDIQRNHKTFTIDTADEKFPNPKEMFSELRENGIKCSTNITPIISMEHPEDAGDPVNNPRYNVYDEGREANYFIGDTRSDADAPDAKTYYYYEGGDKKTAVADGNFNSGSPYIGGIDYGYSPQFYGHYPDFGRKEVRIWWGKQYKYLFDMGLEMVWQDMTTPAIAATKKYWDDNQKKNVEHEDEKNVGLGDMKSFPARLNVTDDFVKAFEDDEAETTPYPKSPVIKVWNLYSYNLHKATYHGLNHLKGRENKRNFIVGRGSFAGAHRFSALWNGDNASTWDFLKINISQCLALGLTGQAMSGQDIGGFEKGYDNGEWADPELLIRWTAMGAFLPWFRNHYTAKEGAKSFQEPYMYKTVRDKPEVPEPYKYMYDAVLPVCKYYIDLRYRLMQLFYDRLFENTLNGMPICRPMFITDDDVALFNDKIGFISNQFLVGNDFLVAPIIEKGQKSRDVYLPSGSDWYNFRDNRWPLADAVEGGITVNFDAHIIEDVINDEDHIPFIVPIYVRAGAIIPTIQRERYVGEFNSHNDPNPITINIYPCKQDVVGSYTMYLDDGVSRSSAAKDINGDEEANDEYRQTDISHKYVSETVRQIAIERKHEGYTPEHEEYFFVAILHDNEKMLKSVTINGVNTKEILNESVDKRAKDLDGSSINAWYYNENIRTTFVKVFDDSSLIDIKVEYNN